MYICAAESERADYALLVCSVLPHFCFRIDVKRRTLKLYIRITLIVAYFGRLHAVVKYTYELYYSRNTCGCYSMTDICFYRAYRTKTDFGSVLPEALGKRLDLYGVTQLCSCSVSLTVSYLFNRYFEFFVYFLFKRAL